MRAHILPLGSTAFFAQGWARLKKQLRGARNRLFDRVPFFFALVLLTGWPPCVLFGRLWALLGTPGLSWGLLERRSGTRVRFPGLPWALLRFPGSTWGVDLGFPSARSVAPGLDLNFLGSIWCPWARSAAPGLDLELLGL